jgi:hypothetical protein
VRERCKAGADEEGLSTDVGEKEKRKDDSGRRQQSSSSNSTIVHFDSLHGFGLEPRCVQNTLHLLNVPPHPQQHTYSAPKETPQTPALLSAGRFKQTAPFRQ